MTALDLAVLPAALAGGLTCCAAPSLFLGALQDVPTGYLSFAFFGAALACAAAPLAAFAFDTVFSGRSLRV